MADEFRALSEVWRTPKAKTLRARLPGWSESYPSHRGCADLQHLTDPLKAAGVDTQCARCGSGGWPEGPRRCGIVGEMEKRRVGWAEMGDKSPQWELKSWKSFGNGGSGEGVGQGVT